MKVTESGARREYLRWLSAPDMEAALLAELRGMEGDEELIEDGFGSALAFGTGGLRGVLGVGTNRMNVYTVARATQGLADYLNGLPGTAKSVVIAHDSRKNGRRFAETAAGVLAANDIRVWLFPRLAPTPLLSFAVRELGCSAGICVTASHNPAEYNGYKVYGADGCQITLEAARAIQSHIDAVDVLNGAQRIPLRQAERDALVQDVPETMWNSYLERVAEMMPGTRESGTPLHIVYTPLNGTGRECVLRILERIDGVKVTVVPEQEWPDESFPTCPYPNPEEPTALARGIALCRDVKGDLLLATDPDCDRVGVASMEGGKCRLLTGNEIGILLLDFLCRSRMGAGTMPSSPVAVTTIVSTDMADAVSAQYGVELRRTLTGFKYIGEQIGRLEAKGEKERFIFGFEESCGYLSGTHARDKDGVNAAMLIACMAADYRAQGLTLGEAMDALYRRYGYYANKLMSFGFHGADGMRRMNTLMRDLRESPPERLAGERVERMLDYLNGLNGLPAADVLSFETADGSKTIVRPSGTEPKLKAYLFARAGSAERAREQIEELAEAISRLIAEEPRA